MRKAIGLAIALLWAATAHSQSAPQVFSAGAGDQIAKFYVHDSADSAKVAFRLPPEIAGNFILGINAYYSQPSFPYAVAPETWQGSAGFVWGLSTGNIENPLAATAQRITVPLKNYPDLQNGGELNVAVEWPVWQGDTYWLVGYWPRSSKFTRLGSNHRNDSTDICVGLIENGQNTWQAWTGGGLMVEVAYGIPDAGTPSGILDLETGSPRSSRPLYAAINSNGLVISLNPHSDPLEPYSSFSLTVVNTLGQTVVSEAGIADFAQITIPWSANRPSGVYFCRIRLGSESHTVPVVNIK